MQVIGSAIGATEDLILHSLCIPACLTILAQDWSPRGDEKWPSEQAFVQSWREDKLQREVHDLCGHKHADVLHRVKGQAAWPPLHQVQLVQQLMELQTRHAVIT